MIAMRTRNKRERLRIKQFVDDYSETVDRCDDDHFVLL